MAAMNDGKRIFNDKRISIDRYIKRKLGILEDMRIVTDADGRKAYLQRYIDAKETSAGNPYSAVDEEHYRILRENVL